MKIRLFSLTACALILHLAVVQAQTRYLDPVFTESEKTSDVVYGTAPFLNVPYMDESQTTNGDLVMDIYQPKGDDQSTRPAIIFAHGGGFVEGDRNHQDMVAFCDSFARKGYVTATIDYRQGVYAMSDAELHYTRAVYRGMQDGRTAVRFLRANAATYGIDPNKIYFVGSSAGAFIGLQNIYMDEAAEKPAYAGESTYGDFPTEITAPDLGDYDIGENLTFEGEPDAVFALWGAISIPNIIEADDQQPVLLVHGKADEIVPFDVGKPFNLSNIPDTYGSKPISEKLTTLGMPAAGIYFVADEGHEFYGVTNGDWDNGTNGNAHWEIVLNKATNFFYSLHQSIEIESKPKSAISLYPNPCSNSLTIATPYNTQMTFTITDMAGRQVKQLVCKGSKNTFDVSDLHTGIYLLRYQTAKGIATEKLLLE